MATVKLPDEQWSKILRFLRSCSDVYVGQEITNRRFVEAVLWVGSSGAQWRLLPAIYGKWNSVYKRFAHWCAKGIWQRMHHHCADDPDLESIMIDSTVIQAHPCAAGAPQKGGPGAKALGRSRGGFSCKIHVCVDALGNPLRFTLTGGQRHDITQAPALSADYSCV
jgi:transposase